MIATSWRPSSSVRTGINFASPTSCCLSRCGQRRREKMAYPVDVPASARLAGIMLVSSIGRCRPALLRALMLSTLGKRVSQAVLMRFDKRSGIDRLKGAAGRWRGPSATPHNSGPTVQRDSGEERCRCGSWCGSGVIVACCNVKVQLDRRRGRPGEHHSGATATLCMPIPRKAVFS